MKPNKKGARMFPYACSFGYLHAYRSMRLCLFLFVKHHCFAGGLQEFVLFLAAHDHILKIT